MTLQPPFFNRENKLKKVPNKSHEYTHWDAAALEHKATRNRSTLLSPHLFNCTSCTVNYKSFAFFTSLSAFTTRSCNQPRWCVYVTGIHLKFPAYLERNYSKKIKKSTSLRVLKLSWRFTAPATLRKWLDLNSGQVVRQLSLKKHSWCRRDERLPSPTGPALPAEGTHFS